jgi:outer membrane receptor for ferrienterochelin and colicins
MKQFGLFCSLLVLFLWVTTLSSPLMAQEKGRLQGKVFNRETGEQLPGATIRIQETGTTIISDHRGGFVINGLEPGRYNLTISYVGHKTMTVAVDLSSNGNGDLEIGLEPNDSQGNEVVVSASRYPELLSRAPASIQIIGQKELDQFAGSFLNELFSKMQGIEFTRYGVNGITLNARGLNSAFNNKLVQLVDGRNSMAALSGGLPVVSSNTGTYNKEDIEKIEVVLGPQAALYGPNAHNMVMNFITKDPRKYPGTTVSVSAGNLYQFSGRLRHAAKLDERWGYKLTGEWVTGREYEFYDSIASGTAIGPSVLIPAQNLDLNFRHLRGEAGIYYRVKPSTDLILSGGGSSGNFLQVTTGGRNRMQDMKYGFLQARLVHANWFLTAYETWGDIGNSYNINAYSRDYWNRVNSPDSDGPNRRLSPDSAHLWAIRNRFREKSRRFNAEGQYRHKLEELGLTLAGGMSFQRERPNGFGINLVDSGRRISITQYGAVVQADKDLPWNMRAMAAVRYDNHSNFGGFISPKFAWLINVGESSFRISWAKAYSMPSIQHQYAGINRSYFGNGGEGIRYIPVNTRLSDSVILQTTPLKPERISTWELGYKGNLAKNFFIDVTYYYGRSRNFITPAIQTFGRVLTVNGFPVTHNPNSAGRLVNDTLTGASFSANYNYGRINSWGIDGAISYELNRYIGFALKYSWFNSDITRGKNDANKNGVISPDEKSLNTPRNRAILQVDFQNLCRERLAFSLSARYVQRYEFYSGSQKGTIDGAHSITAPWLYDWGPLGGFTSFDLSAQYKLNQSVRFNLGISNLFNTRQIEFVGAPSIGRLMVAEIKVDVPKF